MHPVVLVAIGGSMGAVARWGIGEVLATDSESGMPWATLLVNLLGSFALGMLLGGAVGTGIGERWVLLIGVGLLGSFTTMSTFSMELVQMVDRGAVGLASLHLPLNLLAPVMAWFGWMLTGASG